jgi:hypothetical protein
MCQELKTKTGIIHTIAELKAVMPILVKYQGYEYIPADLGSCLCPIDIPATAEANNRQVLYDPFGYTLIEKEVIP